MLPQEPHSQWEGTQYHTKRVNSGRIISAWLSLAPRLQSSLLLSKWHSLSILGTFAALETQPVAGEKHSG